MRKKYTILLLTLLPLLMFTSCATYYQQNLKFQTQLANGELSKAKELLEKDKSKTGKNRVLYLFNKGWLNWMMNENAESNLALDEADKLIEDHKKNYGLEVLALISNPIVKPYTPEDFEAMVSTNIGGYFFVTQQARQGFRATLASCWVLKCAPHEALFIRHC